MINYSDITCSVCKKGFSQQSIVGRSIKIKHRVCPVCINIYLKVDKHLKDLRQQFKSVSYSGVSE